MLRPSLAPVLPASVAVLPFLFMRARADDADWIEATALAAAAAAERAVDEPGNSRRRLAWLVCEYNHQQACRTGHACGSLALTPHRLASTLGIGLAKVKRILALLRLSQVIEIEGDRLRVTDWARLCSLAGYDPARLGQEGIDADGDLLAMLKDEAAAPLPMLTRAGDPACFE